MRAHAWPHKNVVTLQRVHETVATVPWGLYIRRSGCEEHSCAQAGTWYAVFRRAETIELQFSFGPNLRNVKIAQDEHKDID